MTVNVEFEKDLPFDAEFLEFLIASAMAKDAVKFTPQDLNELEQAQARKNIGVEDSPIHYIESASDNPVVIRSLETGTYILKGRFKYYANATKQVAFTTERYILLERFDDRSELQCLMPGGNRVNYTVITDTGYTSDIIKLSELEKVTNRVTTIDESADDEHYPTAKAVYDALGVVTSPKLESQEMYFDIDYDGVVSLKSEYQNGGGKNTELPEIIVIPDVIDGTAVSGLQAGMFQDNLRIKEITIPDGVTELPNYFCKNAKNLKAIHNTEQITKIGMQIILNTQVGKAIFPNLKEVAVGAFAQAFFMYTADIGNNITDIPYGMFRNCTLLSLVKGGGSVKTIGKEAFFYNRNLKNLPLLSQVTSIGDKAFFNCRIQFDWNSIKDKCTFANGAYPVMDNTADYWTGVNHTPCENPLGTTMSQSNPEWAESVFGDSGKKYSGGCGLFSVLHIHSALSGKTYNHPDEFAEELRAIDPSLVTLAKHPTTFANVAPMLNALGYNSENGYTVTVVTDAITQASYQALCDALARGAYIYTQASGYATDGTFTPDAGHAVVLYGINSNNEMLVLDSSTFHSAFSSVGVDDVFTYRMAHQNLCGPDCNFVIVEKKEE